MAKPLDIDEQAICQAYLDGGSERRVAADFGISATSVYRILRRRGIPKRPGGWDGKPNHAPRYQRDSSAEVTADARTREATRKLVQRWQEHEPAGRYV